MKTALRSFLHELRKRSIYKVAVGYGIFAYTLAHIGYILTNSFNSPYWVMQYGIIFLILGFPSIILLTWFYDWTSTGLRRHPYFTRIGLGTCVYTNISQSTQLALKLGKEYSRVLEKHRLLIKDIAKNFHGRLMETIGDCNYLIFDDVNGALEFASFVMVSFNTDHWKNNLGFRIKLGIHTDQFSSDSTNFTGLEVIKTSRISKIAGPNQVLLSGKTVENIRSPLPRGLSIERMGVYNFKGLNQEEMLYELVIEEIKNSRKNVPIPHLVKKLLVIPFENSKDDNFECLFCDGITEELIVMLSQIPHLSVFSRSTSFTFKKRSDNIDNAIASLGVDLLVHGNARISRKNIKVIAELTDPRTGMIIWSGKFKRPVGDMFELQEEITQNIVEALDLKLTGSESDKNSGIRSEDHSANEYFMRARRLYYNYSRHTMNDAYAYYRKSMELDPYFCPALVGAAKCCLFIYRFMGGARKMMDTAMEYINSALGINPNYSDALTIKGNIHTLKKEYPAAAEAFAKSLEYNPDSFLAWYKYGKLCYITGEYEKSARLFEHAHHCRPEDYQSLFFLGQLYEALHHTKLANILRTNAIKLINDVLKINPFDRRALYLGAICQASLGYNDLARKWISDALKTDRNDPLILYGACSVYAIMNEKEKSLNYLIASISTGFSDEEFISRDLNLSNIRQEITGIKQKTKKLYPEMEAFID